MSSDDFSKQGLLTYLKESARSGLLNPAVARSRKTAAEQLLPHVTPEERMNLRLLDVDDLCSRVHKLEDSSLRKEALNLYNSRLKSALADYFSWLDAPESFVSVTSTATVSKAKKHIRNHEEKALEEMTFAIKTMAEELIPIKIRENVTVYIKGIPEDLTEQEANKISKVVKAYSGDK